MARNNSRRGSSLLKLYIIWSIRFVLPRKDECKCIYFLAYNTARSFLLLILEVAHLVLSYQLRHTRGVIGCSLGSPVILVEGALLYFCCCFVFSTLELVKGVSIMAPQNICYLICCHICAYGYASLNSILFLLLKIKFVPCGLWLWVLKRHGGAYCTFKKWIVE